MSQHEEPGSRAVRQEPPSCPCYNCVNEPPGIGFDACSVMECGCTKFVDVYGSELCGNCGHHYSDH